MTRDNVPLDVNKQTYEDLYAEKQAFLRYPADWVIRFHNMYLRSNIPDGRLLDYGCGSGNNSYFFIEQGYDVYGVEVAEESLELVKRNLESRHLNPSWNDRFSIVPPDNISLPYEDGFFDVIVANQVFSYLASVDQIRKVCHELARVLRPGGVVFFSLYGAMNYYFTHHIKQIHGDRVYEIRVDDPSHRLYGLRELVFVVRDKEELIDLFSEFECVTTGYYDARIFDMHSTYHWIFVGKKREP